ncbi:unnamed protein product [Prunus armeniaca]
MAVKQLSFASHQGLDLGEEREREVGFCHIPDRLRRSTILSTLGPCPHGFVSENSQETSQRVTHHEIALAQSRLTSEFPWNLKPVSSQQASY